MNKKTLTTLGVNKITCQLRLLKVVNVMSPIITEACNITAAFILLETVTFSVWIRILYSKVETYF